MSKVKADQFVNNAANGSPLLPMGVRVTGIATATTFDGNLNATQLTSGTVPDARFPATLPAVDGSQLTNLPASGDANDITACLFV